MSNILSFVNGSAYPCGCAAHFSDGHGEYSDVITVKLCEKHQLDSDPDEDAQRAGFYLSASGAWVNTVDMLIESVQRNIKHGHYSAAVSNLEHLKEAVHKEE